VLVLAIAVPPEHPFRLVKLFRPDTGVSKIPTGPSIKLL
jgi:hypothetical protein